MLQHDLGAERAGVVHGGHHPSVGAYQADRDQISLARLGQPAVERKEVALLAEGADEVDGQLLPAVRNEDDDGMFGAVEDGAQQVVAAAVADGEGLAAGLFYADHPRHESPGGPDQVAARLEQQGGIQRARCFRERCGVGREV